MKEVRQYNTGDVVLGKVHGYPLWPGIVSARSRVNLKKLTKMAHLSFFFSFFFFPLVRLLQLGGRSRSSQ